MYEKSPIHLPWVPIRQCPVITPLGMLIDFLFSRSRMPETGLSGYFSKEIGL